MICIFLYNLGDDPFCELAVLGFDSMVYMMHVGG